MDRNLSALIAKDTPKLNQDICNGLATKHMAHCIQYVHEVMEAASKGFPPGLVYKGCARCTPQEEFNIVTRLKGTKRTFDIARSDIFLMQYFFSYNGKDLPPRYLFLPYVSDAGTIVLGGSRFNISPVLADKVISIGVSNIFVRLLRDRLTFERSSHHFIMDNRRETVQVAWSTIYHKNSKLKKIKQTVKANSTMMHYLLCKYGFTDTFLKFAGCEPVVGGGEINSNSYPEDEWVICSSSQLKPKGCGKGFYEPSNLRVAIRRKDVTPLVKNMLGGFFYVVDHFPTRIQPSAEYVNSKRLWMVLLGHIIFSGNINEGKLHDDIQDHITSLDEYLDGIVVKKLKEIGINVNNIYDLFAIIIEKFNDWILSSSDKVSSMYDKELSILYYALYEITSAIFKLYFKLKAASKKVLTEKEITNTMNSILKPGLVYSMTRGHSEVSSLSYSGDNKAFKITSLLIPQSSNSRNGGKGDKSSINDPSVRMHVSVAEIGGYANMPKGDPTGRSRINQHVLLDSRGGVMRREEYRELLDNIQRNIQY